MNTYYACCISHKCLYGATSLPGFWHGSPLLLFSIGQPWYWWYSREQRICCESKLQTTTRVLTFLLSLSPDTIPSTQLWPSVLTGRCWYCWSTRFPRTPWPPRTSGSDRTPRAQGPVCESPLESPHWLTNAHQHPSSCSCVGMWWVNVLDVQVVAVWYGYGWFSWFTFSLLFSGRPRYPRLQGRGWTQRRAGKRPHNTEIYWIQNKCRLSLFWWGNCSLMRMWMFLIP